MKRRSSGADLQEQLLARLKRARLRPLQEGEVPGWLEELSRVLETPRGELTDLQTVAILFEVAGERCAVAARWVFEVLRWYAPSSIPGAPRGLLGALLYAGDLLPVFAYAGGEEGSGSPGGPRLVLVLGAGRPGFGLAVREVRGVVPLRDVPAEYTLLDGDALLQNSAYFVHDLRGDR